MARAPRGNQDRSGQPVRRTFYIVDKTATHLGPIELTKDHRKNGIELTDSEAQFFLASGAISTVDPRENEGAARVMAEQSGEPAFDPSRKSASTKGK